MARFLHWLKTDCVQKIWLEKFWDGNGGVHGRERVRVWLEPNPVAKQLVGYRMGYGF